MLGFLKKIWPADPDIALDMGSARTRLFVAGRGVIADIASASQQPGGALELASSPACLRARRPRALRR
jgi:hypothetical protein